MTQVQKRSADRSKDSVAQGAVLGPCICNCNSPQTSEARGVPHLSKPWEGLQRHLLGEVSQDRVIGVQSETVEGERPTVPHQVRPERITQLQPAEPGSSNALFRDQSSAAPCHLWDPARLRKGACSPDPPSVPKMLRETASMSWHLPSHVLGAQESPDHLLLTSLMPSSAQWK